MLRTHVSALTNSTPIPWTFYEYPQFMGFRKICVVNSFTVWLSGGGWDSSTSAWKSALVHTTDGGRTIVDDRHKVPSGQYINGGVVFVDQQNGWLTVIDGKSYRSIDAGASWQHQTTWTLGDPQILPSTAQELYGAEIRPGIPDGTIRLKKSIDSGTTWNTISESQLMDSPRKFFKRSPQSIWLLGGSSIWYYTPVTPPTITLPRSVDTVQIGQAYQYNYTRTGLGLQDSLVRGLPWMQLSPGRISGTASGSAGAYTIRVMVRDTVWQIASASYQLTVLPAPPPPVVTQPSNDTTIASHIYAKQIVASGVRLRYSLAGNRQALPLILCSAE